jgi:hypothetical protein
MSRPARVVALALVAPIGIALEPVACSWVATGPSYVASRWRISCS